MWKSYLPLSTFSSLWLLGWCTMVSRILVYSLLALAVAVAVAVASVDGNSEVDALHAWKTTLADPYNTLQSWDPTLVNPCTWNHITCNNDNSVVRVDLGNAGISGNLIPQLGTLANLQYLEVFRNNLSGAIPEAIGNLTNLISLDLYENRFSGPIPSSLGNLISLRFLRLNSNQLSGRIPAEVLQLVTRGNLIVFNVSDNQMIGRAHFTRKTGFAVTEIIQDPKAQK